MWFIDKANNQCGCCTCLSELLMEYQTWTLRIKRAYSMQLLLGTYRIIQCHESAEINPQAINVIYIYIYIYGAPILDVSNYTQRRTTVGKTPLDERSARRRDLYLTTHDTHNRQISMPPVGFEPTISAAERIVRRCV